MAEERPSKFVTKVPRGADLDRYFKFNPPPEEGPEPEAPPEEEPATSEQEEPSREP